MAWPIDWLFMLRFYTAGESHGQGLLTFLSGLPAGLPVMWSLSIMSCTGGSSGMAGRAAED